MKILVVMFLLMASLCYAQPYQYVVHGLCNDKKVTGFVTSYENGTIVGNVDNEYVVGWWTGLGVMEAIGESGFYELEVSE